MELAEATERLARRRDALRARGVAARTVAFTSQTPGRDIVRLASEQDADLVLLSAGPGLPETGAIDGDVGAVLSDAPCDVALVAGRGDTPPDASKPVKVPVGGAEHEWAAVELGAWVASARGVPLVLSGRQGTRRPGRRCEPLARPRLAGDAARARSRLHADARSARRRGRARGRREASLLVMGLSDRWRQEGLGATRLAVSSEGAGADPDRPPRAAARRARPRESLTRFTWSLTAE